MATIPYGNKGVRFLNNLPEYGNNYGIPLVSELTMFINGVTLAPAEVVYAVRFYLEQSNGNKLYSPEIPYNGIGEVTYNFGKIQKNWITQGVSFFYLSVAWEVRTNIVAWGDSYYHGVYGIGAEILNYDLPSITAYNAARSLAVSTTADYSLNCSVSELSTDPALKNYLKYKFQYLDVTWVDAMTIVSAPGVAISTLFSHALPYIESQSYQTRVIVLDKFNTIFAYDVLPTALVPFSVSRRGIGVGKIIEHEDAAMDIEGLVYRNNVLQPKIFMKKPSDPDPDGMEDGDVLLIFNDVLAFSSSNFPQEFGTGFVWDQVGVWPTPYYYWTSMASTSNSIIESFQVSAFKGDNYPSLMFDANVVYYNGYNMPQESAPITVIVKFKGKINFNSFTLTGWGSDHEPKNSPKSFAFFGSNDGMTWTPLYDTIAFANTHQTSASAAMNNSGMAFSYLKMVWRSNQDDNKLTPDPVRPGGYLSTMISVRELVFNASGIRYV